MNLISKLSSGSRSRLLVFLGTMLLVGFLLTSTISYLVSRTSIRSAILRNELPLSSNNIYSEIQHDLFQPILISSLMANDTFVKDWLEKGEQDESAITKYLDHIRERYGTVTAFLVSERTRKYYNTTGVLKEVEESNPVDAWFFRVRAMATDYELNVDPDMSNSNAMTIFINYRVVDKEGKFLAATGVGLSVSAVKRLMQEYHERYQRDVYFYDRKGQLVLRSPMIPGSKAADSNHTGEEEMRVILDKINRGETGASDSVVGSNGAMANYRFIPELNWILVVEQVSDGTKTILYQTFGFNFLVCLTITALLLVIFRRAFLRYQGNLEAKNVELKNANASRERLFSIIGHDLRGPVANVKECLDRLSDETLDIESFEEIRDDLRRGVDHVLVALGNLMEWGNLQVGPLKAKPERMNMRVAAEEEIQLLSLLAKEKLIGLRNDIPEEAWVQADPRQIKSVLRNLLSNAIKFTPKSGRIVFSGEEERERWKFRVSDSGTGMEADKIKALLGRRRNHDSTPGTEGERGLGLGLQICVDFIRANKGSLEAESMPGAGTTFLVTLPTAS